MNSLNEKLKLTWNSLGCKSHSCRISYALRQGDGGVFLGSYRNLIVVYTNLALSITNALALDYLKKALVKQSQYFIQKILRRNYCANELLCWGCLSILSQNFEEVEKIISYWLNLLQLRQVKGLKLISWEDNFNCRLIMKLESA